jgi:hypothetical protein
LEEIALFQVEFDSPLRIITSSNEKIDIISNIRACTYIFIRHCWLGSERSRYNRFAPADTGHHLCFCLIGVLALLIIGLFAWYWRLSRGGEGPGGKKLSFVILAVSVVCIVSIPYGFA